MDVSNSVFPIINPEYDKASYFKNYRSEITDLNKQIKSGKFRRDTWKSKDNIILIKRACILAYFISHDLDMIDSDFDAEDTDSLLLETFLPVCIYLIDDLGSEPHQITGN